MTNPVSSNPEVSRREQLENIALEVEPMLHSLYVRWQHERGHEGFEGYAEVARAAVERHGARFLDMSKRPFRVILEVQGVRCFIKVTAREYYWGVMASPTHH